MSYEDWFNEELNAANDDTSNEPDISFDCKCFTSACQWYEELLIKAENDDKDINMGKFFNLDFDEQDDDQLNPQSSSCPMLFYQQSDYVENETFFLETDYISEFRIDDDELIYDLNDVTPDTMSNKDRIKDKNATFRNFTCTQNNCGKSFQRRNELKRHIRMHTGERPFMCSFCPRGFSRSDHRRTHIRTHTGEKPYQCSFCSKHFTRSDEKKRHEKIHNKSKVNADGRKGTKSLSP